jgi:hypothetical protein
VGRSGRIVINGDILNADSVGGVHGSVTGSGARALRQRLMEVQVLAKVERPHGECHQEKHHQGGLDQRLSTSFRHSATHQGAAVPVYGNVVDGFPLNVNEVNTASIVYAAICTVIDSGAAPFKLG